ncbi:MAG: hypothetical protein Kow0080_19230 [Candidatus Promineifilaceae bacterium]
MAAYNVYQNDPHWQDVVLGNGEPDQTIGKMGCLLASLTFAVNFFGGQETPAVLNAKLMAGGLYQGMWIRPYTLPTITPNITVSAHIHSHNQPAPLPEIDHALSAGSLALVCIDYSPTAGVQHHWLVLHKKTTEDDYAIWDPYHLPDAPKTLQGCYGFSGSPAEIIQETLIVSKAGASAKLPSAKPFCVTPMVNGLTIRSKPVIHPTNLMKYLAYSDVLLVLEDEEQAEAKIGQLGQWLHVRDIEGDEGYVAAWYVTAVHNPALGPYPTYAYNLASPPTKTIVKANAAQLPLYPAPQADTTPIATLSRGAELLVSVPDTQQTGWLYVQTIDGRQGYVQASQTVPK